MNFFQFVAIRYSQILRLLFEHIQITILAVALAVLIGVPLGILVSGQKNFYKPVMSVINACQAVPSLAFMGFLIPLVGIGMQTAIILVVIYALLPIVKNTTTGIVNIDRDVTETARGMGLTKMQILMRIQFPVALPVIMAGVRIASVTAVGLVTIAAYAGGRGLGYMVYSGINTVDINMILAGAIPACLLALTMDFLIGRVEKIVTPEGLAADEKRP